MKIVEKDIELLMDKWMGEFHTDNGLLYYLNANRSVFVIAPFQNYCTDTIDVGICSQLANIQESIEALKVASMSDFKNLSIEPPLALYTKSRADIYCSIIDHGDFPLRFRRMSLGISVLDD